MQDETMPYTVNPVLVAEAAAAAMYPGQRWAQKLPACEVPQEAMDLYDSPTVLEVEGHTIHVRHMQADSDGAMAFVYNVDAVPF